MKLLFTSLLIGLSQISFSQKLTENNKEYIAEHAMLIDKNDNFKNAQWDFLAETIKGKKVVAIGEFNHGSKEVFALRNSLIKYLHEEQGFDVVLFESGLGEIIEPSHQKKSISPEKMTSGFFRIWQTQGFADLMKYIQKKDMEISAFDVQRSGSSFNAFLQTIAEENEIRLISYGGFEERFSTLSQRLKKENFDEIKGLTRVLISDYKRLKIELDHKWEDKPTKDLLFASRVVENRVAYLQYYLDFAKTKNWNVRFDARDSVMASNVIWLSENIFPNQKIILVAHNYHVSKFNHNQLVMGEILKQNFGNSYYTIGSYAGEGKYAGNAGEEKTIEVSDSTRLDVKDVINTQKGFAHFISMPAVLDSYSNFLLDPFVINDSFIDLNRTETLTPYRHFDALLLIKKSSMPEFLK